MRCKILIITIVLCGITYATGKNVYVYRNDNAINQLSTADSTVVTHRAHGDGINLCTPRDTIPVEVVDSIVVRHIDVPVLRFTLPENPDLTWVRDKNNYIPARLDIEGNGMVDSEEGLELYVKGRGNSSWGFPKKPMRLKFNKKTAICGFGKAKSYVLLADCVDPTLMRNATAFWIARQMGVDFVNTFMPCHVYVNDHYAGAYLLTEKISINKASVDIDDSKGVLIEMSTEYDEDYKFRSALYDLPVMIKDPDLAEIAEEYPDYLADCRFVEEPIDPVEPLAADDILRAWELDFKAAECKADTLAGAEAFDMLSFVNMMLVNDLVLNNEIGHPKSVYMYKEGLGEEHKYKFGPVWDFDLSFNSVALNGKQEIHIPHDGFLWLNPLFKQLVEQPEFMPLFEERWNYFMTEVYPQLFDWIDSYCAMTDPMAKMNAMRWPNPHQNGWVTAKYNTFDHATRVAELKTWLHKRIRHIHKATKDGIFYE